MGMFTQIFSKSHNPYELKGRWYKISVDVDGSDFSLISSDIPQYDWGDSAFNIAMIFDRNTGEIIVANCDILSVVPVVKSITQGSCNFPADYRIAYDYFKYYYFDLVNFTQDGSVKGKIELYIYAIPYATVTNFID